MLTEARVVVIGGGNMGAGVLYHLARHGPGTSCIAALRQTARQRWSFHIVNRRSRASSGESVDAFMPRRCSPLFAISRVHDDRRRDRRAF